MKHFRNPLETLCMFTGFFRLIGIIIILILFSFSLKAQCVNPPSLAFHNPVLISGINGEIGAVYLFSNVAPSLDAHVEILGLYGGARLAEIDNTSQGYFDAWQPYVTASALDTSYLEWRISFKKQGTSTDTILPCLAVTAIDVDGDNASLKEFVEAGTPGGYAVDPMTNLLVTFDGTRTKAIGQLTTVPMIDTSERQVMFQMNFLNVNNIVYRNGAISTKAAQDIRHTCIYFKSFFDFFYILPARVLSFHVSAYENKNLLNWTVTEEKSVDYYTIQRSSDGVHFEDISRVNAANNMKFHTDYQVSDYQVSKGIIYYRIVQIDRQNRQTFSTVIICNRNIDEIAITYTTMKNMVEVNLVSPTQDAYIMEIYGISGELIQRKHQKVYAGINQFYITPSHAITSGVYIITFRNKAGKLVHKGKIMFTLN